MSEGISIRNEKDRYAPDEMVVDDVRVSVMRWMDAWLPPDET